MSTHLPLSLLTYEPLQKSIFLFNSYGTMLKTTILPGDGRGDGAGPITAKSP